MNKSGIGTTILIPLPASQFLKFVLVNVQKIIHLLNILKSIKTIPVNVDVKPAGSGIMAFATRRKMFDPVQQPFI